MAAEYENAVRGRLKLKGGKALDVKAASGFKKKKKAKAMMMMIENQNRDVYGQSFKFSSDYVSAGGNTEAADSIEESDVVEKKTANWYDHMTPAERRYMERRAKLDMQRLAKMVSKSHRDGIQAFNQYLANLSEHYDIPKVGPG